MTTSSLQYFLPGILVGLLNLPDGLSTSPGPRRGGEADIDIIEHIDSLRLVAESDMSIWKHRSVNAIPTGAQLEPFGGHFRHTKLVTSTSGKSALPTLNLTTK
ncbi:hypothetical protein MTP99_009809 [Tenebrio molitor]|nr:hypothetical protein MTP99_009809 [Tenebrio molitor]